MNMEYWLIVLLVMMIPLAAIPIFGIGGLMLVAVFYLLRIPHKWLLNKLRWLTDKLVDFAPVYIFFLLCLAIIVMIIAGIVHLFKIDQPLSGVIASSIFLLLSYLIIKWLVKKVKHYKERKRLWR